LGKNLVKTAFTFYLNDQLASETSTLTKNLFPHSFVDLELHCLQHSPAALSKDLKAWVVIQAADVDELDGWVLCLLHSSTSREQRMSSTVGHINWVAPCPKGSFSNVDPACIDAESSLNHFSSKDPRDENCKPATNNLRDENCRPATKKTTREMKTANQQQKT
jgi:hypothetical protein